VSEVVVRQWSERVFAGYAVIGGRWMLVGTEETRRAAYDFALSVVNDPREVENRCYNSIFASQPLAWHAKRERTSVGELGCARRERVNAQDRRTTRTPDITRSLQ